MSVSARLGPAPFVVAAPPSAALRCRPGSPEKQKGSGIEKVIRATATLLLPQLPLTSTAGEGSGAAPFSLPAVPLHRREKGEAGSLSLPPLRLLSAHSRAWESC